MCARAEKWRGRRGLGEQKRSRAIAQTPHYQQKTHAEHAATTAKGTPKEAKKRPKQREKRQKRSSKKEPRAYESAISVESGEIPRGLPGPGGSCCACGAAGYGQAGGPPRAAKNAARRTSARQPYALRKRRNAPQLPPGPGKSHLEEIPTDPTETCKSWGGPIRTDSQARRSRESAEKKEPKKRASHAEFLAVHEVDRGEKKLLQTGRRAEYHPGCDGAKANPPTT